MYQILAEQIGIDVRRSGSDLEISTDYPASCRHASCWVEYHLRVPASLAVRATTKDGDVEIRGVSGDDNPPTRPRK